MPGAELGVLATAGWRAESLFEPDWKRPSNPDVHPKMQNAADHPDIRRKQQIALAIAW
jgi:hypothetical protein